MPSLQTSKSSPKPPMTSLAEIVQNDVVLQELHDSVEKELIETVSRWSLRVIVVLPGAAAILLYRDGQDIFINPFIVSLVAMIAGFFSLSIQWTVCFGTLTLLIVKHSLESGCSASLVPAIYGFIPCAFGFLFRTTKVVVMSTIMVLLATLYIVSIDLLDQCTSEPIASTQKMDILADRFMPLLTLILGNSIIIIAIVKQSRKSVLLHAKAAQSAAKLAHVRRDVLHRVTHELRTPLVGIVGSVELLTTSETMNDQDMENALTIKSSLERIVRICDDVLMAAKSKTDHSNDNVRKESVFSVASCVDDVVDIFGAAAAQKGIALKVDYRGDTQVMVRGMEVELRQVLLNLTGNAMKFTNTGSITIRVIQEDKSHFTDDGNVVRYRFEVQDTGIGIVAENASMLFEAFQQGEQNVVSRQHKGTGLGLTICKDFVERMGGEIRADGSQGKGSRFYFTLDLKKEEWAGEKEGVVVEKDSRRIRVVIADAEQESAATCHSVVSSIAPSALVKTVASVTDSLDAVIDSGDEKSSDIRVAFVDCDSIESTALVSTLLRLKDAGWLVFAHADHKGFSDLIEKSHDAYAVFRRPLPLIRIGGTLRHAINGVAPPLPKPSASQTKDGVDKKTAVNENLAPPKSLVDDHSVKVNDASQRSKRKAHRTASVELRPGSSVVVVDDTPVNVKVLVKMLSRATSVPILSCFDGQSAVELVSSSNREDLLLFLMDWHMPGICGLTATDSIRRITKERGGPSVYICMITADIEGLHTEMERRNMTYEGTVSKGELVTGGDRDNVSTTESEDEIATANRLSRRLERQASDGFTVVDIVAEKPVTFKSIQAILSWFQRQIEQTADSSLSARYFKRLQLNRVELDALSPLERLQEICAAHLEHIPFENLSQHGVGEPASLETEKLANKLLDRRRGGFCFELNGLLAELLLELGYHLVRVIAHVYAGDSFMDKASHMVLIVTLPDSDKVDQEAKYLVDVGFAEPAIHPLRYEFDIAQTTPEGMVSRLVTRGDYVVLEWLDIQSGAFVPRYKFKASDALADMPGPALAEFQDNLMAVYHPESHFAQKFIVCRVDQSTKKTVAGTKMKITGPPRFDKGIVPVVRELEDLKNVRTVLESDFGIPFEETEGLELSKSLESPPEMWM